LFATTTPDVEKRGERKKGWESQKMEHTSERGDPTKGWGKIGFSGKNLLS